MLRMTQLVTSMLPILKPLTFPLLEAVQKAMGTGTMTVSTALCDVAVKWLSIYHGVATYLAPNDQRTTDKPDNQHVLAHQ